MKISVVRNVFNDSCTVGELFVDGVHECFTLEDVVRPDGAPKVFGQTAIPFGTYNVVVTFSPHFNRLLPLLVDVPGFSGVRIHPGNTAADTEGCLLVGRQHTDNSVTESRLAFGALYAKIQAALAAGKPVTITYSRGGA